MAADQRLTEKTRELREGPPRVRTEAETATGERLADRLERRATRL